MIQNKDKVAKPDFFGWSLADAWKVVVGQLLLKQKNGNKKLFYYDLRQTYSSR